MAAAASISFIAAPRRHEPVADAVERVRRGRSGSVGRDVVPRGEVAVEFRGNSREIVGSLGQLHGNKFAI